jgi:HlyD family secretion protein
MKSIFPRNIKAGLKLLSGVGAVSGLMLLCYGFVAGPSDLPGSQWKTGAVKQGPMEITVACTGSLKAVGTVEVGTEVSGTIDRVLVDYNHRVRKGQVLAELDLELFQNAVDEAKAKQMAADALYRQALSEYNRNRPLHEQGHLSDQEFLEYQTTLATCLADLQSGKAALAKAQTNLRKARILSPIDGTVIERKIEAGQTVAASYSTPTLFILAEDLARMEIEADVDESDIGQIRKGQKVRFTVQAYPEKEFDGEVGQIRLNPTEESNVVTYTVVVSAPNPEGLLLPGMTATADFIIDEMGSALLVPNAALQYAARIDPDADGKAVFTHGKDGRLKRIAVTAGLSDGLFTAVTGAGLAAGLEVVTGESEPVGEAGGSLFSRLMPRPPRGGKP